MSKRWNESNRTKRPKGKETFKIRRHHKENTGCEWVSTWKEQVRWYQKLPETNDSFTECFKRNTFKTLSNVKTLDILELIHICVCSWVWLHIYRHGTGEEEKHISNAYFINSLIKEELRLQIKPAQCRENRHTQLKGKELGFDKDMMNGKVAILPAQEAKAAARWRRIYKWI